MSVEIASPKQKLVNQIHNIQKRGGRGEDNLIRGVVRNYWREYGMDEANSLIDSMGLTVPKFDEESPIVEERNKNG